MSGVPRTRAVAKVPFLAAAEPTPGGQLVCTMVRCRAGDADVLVRWARPMEKAGKCQRVRHVSISPYVHPMFAFLCDQIRPPDWARVFIDWQGQVSVFVQPSLPEPIW